MIAFPFRRRLKPEYTFADFKEGWKAEKGYPVKNRVVNALNVADPRDIVSIGFVDIPKLALKMVTKRATKQDLVETDRHDRVDQLIESTQLKAQFEVVG